MPAGLIPFTFLEYNARVKFAEIVVNVPLHTNPARAHADEASALAEATESGRIRAFTYSIPESLDASLAPGQLVWVPFGARRVQGVVLARRDTSPVETTRDILEIVDPQPFISPVQLDLARWIADEYLAMLSDAVWLFLPPGIEQKFETLLSVAPDAGEQNLNDKQRGLLEMIRQAGELRLARVPPQYRSQVESLTRAGHLQRRSRLTAPRSKPKQVRAVRLLMSPDQAMSTLEQDTRGTRAQKRRAIVEFLAREPGPVWLSALYAAQKRIGAAHDLDQVLGPIGRVEENLDDGRPCHEQPDRRVVEGDDAGLVGLRSDLREELQHQPPPEILVSAPHAFRGDDNHRSIHVAFPG